MFRWRMRSHRDRRALINCSLYRAAYRAFFGLFALALADCIHAGNGEQQKPGVDRASDHYLLATEQFLRALDLDDPDIAFEQLAIPIITPPSSPINWAGNWDSVSIPLPCTAR